ncbi:hypothetical protein Tco_1284963 [Tanacetum coccineum]
MQSISKGWFNKIRVQPWITVLVPTRHDKLWIHVGAFLTQGKASSIPTVFSWGDIDNFLPSILLLLVIIVAVVIVVMVILVVVVGEVMAGAADVDVFLGAILSTFTRQQK